MSYTGALQSTTAAAGCAVDVVDDTVQRDACSASALEPLLAAPTRGKTAPQQRRAAASAATAAAAAPASGGADKTSGARVGPAAFTMTATAGSSSEGACFEPLRTNLSKQDAPPYVT
jgi:hypothetical protein